MHIHSITIENFKAIKYFHLDNLPRAIVLAGPNGCGKSCVFDALRLLKSGYGQYSPNEYQLWFNEHQIDINRVRDDTSRFLYDPKKPLYIQVKFKISQIEKQFIKDNARSLYLQLNWASFRGMRLLDGSAILNPAQKRNQSPIVESQTAELITELTKVIDDEFHTATLVMEPGKEPVASPCPVMELIFSLYRPQDIGVIDYHGPNRSYMREQIGNLNLKISDANDKKSQHALYNSQNKYTGVKQEMAQSYVKQLLAKQAGVPIDNDNDLKSTLDELFNVFFPGKTFMGVIPTTDGSLEFPVMLENGRKHDINELSSGEKEVLLGYLRLRNNAPRNSIILLDEPELHLNPRLIRGLPRFYQKHVGEEFGNQLWLITHSDTLLREAVEDPDYSVYHMQLAHNIAEGNNQVALINADDELERTVIDLVGDLATFSPKSTIVLLEGENSDFDASLIRELFPEFSESINLISVGNKYKVKTLHDLLDKIGKDTIKTKVFSIVDKDFDSGSQIKIDNKFTWDVYHIENFLLNSHYILKAMRSLALGKELPTEEQINTVLKECAKETIDNLIKIKMDQNINVTLINCLSTKFSDAHSITEGFRFSIDKSVDKINLLLENELNEQSISSMEDELRTTLHNSLKEDTWLMEFKGRDILKRFCNHYHSLIGISYERFRNLVISLMREDRFKPVGMSKILDQIRDN